MRRYARQDSNHKEIRACFEKYGCSVADLSALGKGCPDLLIGLGGLCLCVEVKDGKKPPSKQKLTKDEEKFRMNWTGGYRLVTCLEDAEETVKVLEKWHKAIQEYLAVPVAANHPSMEVGLKEDHDYHALLALLRRYTTYSTQAVGMVNNHLEVIKALEILAKLDKRLLERWADPNYG